MKSRQIRKKVEDSDSESCDDSDVKVLKLIHVKKKKIATSTSAVLSFEASDNEEEASFQVKKTKQSRAVKKRMMQAPGVLDTYMDVTPSYAVTGNEYSAEYLQALREKQNFVTSTTVDSTIELEGIELSGDAAESFEGMVEDNMTVVIDSIQQPYQRDASNITHGFTTLQPLDEISVTPGSKKVLGDYIPLEPSSSLSSDVSKVIDRKFIPSGNNDDDLEEDRTWEEELARRGGVKSTSTASHSHFPQQNEVVSSGRGSDRNQVGRTSFSNGPGQTPASSFPTLTSISSSLRNSIAALSDSCDRANRQLRSIDSSLAASKEEESELTKKVSSRVEQLSFLRVSNTSACVPNM